MFASPAGFVAAATVCKHWAGQTTLKIRMLENAVGDAVCIDFAPIELYFGGAGKASVGDGVLRAVAVMAAT